MTRIAALTLAVAALAISGCAFTTVQPATDLTNHSAILKGTIGGLDGSTTGEYRFEWGETTAYELSDWPVQHVRFLPGEETAAVSLPVGNLEPGTTHHYRVCAKDTGATEEFCSRDATFVTPTAAPSEPKVYVTERCGTDSSPERAPSYGVLTLSVGLPVGETVTTLLTTGGQPGIAVSQVIGADGIDGTDGLGPVPLGGDATVTVFDDSDNDQTVDAGETVYDEASITDVCSDNPQEPRDSVMGPVVDEPCPSSVPSGEICRSFQAFDSHSGPSGENPTRTVRIQYAVRQESVVRDYPVSCLVVDGNRATVAIVGDFSETVVIYVEDNGTAGQDRIAVTDELFSTPPDFECPPPVAPSDARTVGSGIVVTDAQPQTGTN